MFWVALSSASLSLSPIADVRVGEEGDKVRVEVLCTQQCDAEPIGETSFLITWARGDFIARVGHKTQYIEQIRVETENFGAAIHIDPVAPPRAVTVNRCGTARLCIDFDFSQPEPQRSAVPSLAALEAELDQLMRQANYQAPAATPSLRPSNLPAERTRPTTLASVPRGMPVRGPSPTLAAVRAQPPAREIAAAPLPADSRATCRAAEAALAADAWNLGAYQTVSICRATRKDSQESAQYLGRLQRYADSSAAAMMQSALR